MDKTAEKDYDTILMTKPRHRTRSTVKIADLLSELGLPESALRSILQEVNVRLEEGQKNLDGQEAAKVRQYLSEQRRREDLKKQVIALPSIVKIQDLAKMLQLPVGDILSQLLKYGVTATLNDDLDYDTAAIVASDLGYATEEKVEELEKGVMNREKLKEVLRKEDPDKQIERPPVVTLMGHVDHGKCVHPDSRVALASGDTATAKSLWQHYSSRGKVVRESKHEQVVEVEDGPEVMSWDGSRITSARVSHLWRLSATEPLVTLILKSGDRLSVTPEHPCLCVTSSGEMAFHPAGKITPGDHVVVPQTLPLKSLELDALKAEILRRLAAAGNMVAFLDEAGTATIRGLLKTYSAQQLLRDGVLTTSPSTTRRNRFRVADLLHMTERFNIPLDEMYSSISRLKNATEKWRAGHTSKSMRLPQTDDDFARLGYLLGVIIGDGHVGSCEVAIHNNNREIKDACRHILTNVLGVSPVEKRGHTADMLSCGASKTFVRFLEAAFDLPAGSKSGTARVPSLVKRYNPMRREVIAGIFDTDGYVSKLNHSAELVTKSTALAFDVASLLLETGTHAAIGAVRKGAKKSSYGTVRIANRPYVSRFADHYHLRHRGKRRRLERACLKARTSRVFDSTPIPGSLLEGHRIPESVLPYFNAYKCHNTLSRPFLTRLFKERGDIFTSCFGHSQLKPLVNPGEISAVPVTKIERTPAPYVYDFSVPGYKNFVAERTIIHNTTLLDSIREANAAAGEAGGITQAISSYQAKHKERLITFIDTPGHETFQFMRRRGASLADIAILVVAADDGVKPQTKEAASHAREAGVPVIVAINKIDKVGINLDKVKKELAEIGLNPEEWGGKTTVVPVSALKKQGVEDLLEMVLLTADINPPKAIPDRLALGSVIESRLDKHLGPLASVLIHTGTLNAGDNVVIGQTTGRVRRLLDFQGKPAAKALPSSPATIVGLNDVPAAGDVMQAVTAREEARSKAGLSRAPVKKLSDLAEEGDKREVLPLVIKADSQGSLEALEQTITAMAPPEVRLSIIRMEVGAVSDSDVLTAAAAGALIYTFNTNVSGMSRKLAEKEQVPIKSFNIIYRLTDDVREEIEKRLPVATVKKSLGKLKVLKIFFSTQKHKIVGGEVSEGTVESGAKITATRKEGRGRQEVMRGEIAELQRERQKITRAGQGDRVGITVEGKGKIKEGDVLEVYKEEKVRQEMPAAAKS